MPETQAFTRTLVVVECSSCNCVFGMTKERYDLAHRDGANFYCINGHPQCFRETDAQKVGRELSAALAKANREKQSALDDAAWERQQRMTATTERKRVENQLRATKGVVTRTKNRIANGVCPCCSRHVTNLERHIRGQHPNYAASEASEK